MILAFSTQLNGKPTYFVEKIITDLTFRKIISFEDANTILRGDLVQYINKSGIIEYFEIKFNNTVIHSPKIHTIREDKKNRWKRGTKIDFFINCRQKNMFRFAPVLEVTSTQRIFMTYMPHIGNGFQVSIGGNEISKEEIKKLAFNDGFENVEDFENYFISVMKEDEFSGKIIHWTDEKY